MRAQMLLLAGVAALLAACAPTATSEPPATATPGLRLMPSGTPAPVVSTPNELGQAGTPRVAATPVIIASPTATATPVTHAVQEGESLLGIAIDYGVSLEALQAANPEVQAQFLSIGTVLVIPPPEGGLAVEATNLAPPPLAPVMLGQPACYAQASGSLVCLVEARNPSDLPVENVSARLTLAGDDGLPFASAVGFAALDLIPPGGALPLAVLFQPIPSQAIAAIGVALVTGNLAAPTELGQADPAPPGRAVLLPVAAPQGGLLGGRWTVAGQVSNPTDQPLGTTQVALALYDAAGLLIGYRKQTLIPGLAPGEVRAFTLAADVLAGEVDHFTVFAEGRP